MNPFLRSLFLILFLNVLTTFQAFSGPKPKSFKPAERPLTTAANRRFTEAQPSYAAVARRGILENGPAEQQQPSTVTETTAEESQSNESREEDVEARLQQKRQKMESLKSQLQLLQNGVCVLSVENFNKLVGLSAAFNQSQNAIRGAYQLRDYITSFLRHGIDPGNDCYRFLDTVAAINEQNARRAYAELNNFSNEIKNSPTTEQYRLLIENAFAEAEREISQLQNEMRRTRSMTMTSEISDLTNDTHTTSSASFSSAIVHQKAANQPRRPQTLEDRELAQVRQFIEENQWYTFENGKPVRSDDPMLGAEQAYLAAAATAADAKDASTVAATLDPSDESEEEKSDEEESSTVVASFDQLHIKGTPSSTSTNRLSKKSKKKKQPQRSSKNGEPQQSFEASLEAKIRREYKVDFSDFSPDEFQDRCAALAQQIVTNQDAPEYASYLKLIKELPENVIDGMKNLQRYNYFPNLKSDNRIIEDFKRMIFDAVNKAYKEKIIQEKLRQAIEDFKKREAAAAAACAEVLGKKKKPANNQQTAAAAPVALTISPPPSLPKNKKEWIAHWKQKFEERFPPDSSELENNDRDKFQITAADIARSLVNNLAYAHLFAGIPEEFIAVIKGPFDRNNLLDYGIQPGEHPAVLPLKQEVKKRFYEEASQAYIDKMIKESKKKR